MHAPFVHPRLPADIVEAAALRRGRPHVYDGLVPARTALVVIDLQRAFMDEGAPSEVPQARAIVPTVNRVADALRQAGGTVAWVQASFDRRGWPLFFDYMATPEHSARILAALQPGAELHALWPGLDVRDDDVRVPKYRLSAFLPGASPLPLILRDRGVDTVLIAGCMTNVCCDSSARDAVMTDFRTVMIEDANATRTDAAHLAALTTFLQAFGDVREADGVIAMLATGRRAANG
jgi:ureidoacrylate peracid hydrolase